MYNPDKTLSLALDIGEHMLISGGEVSRVENTILRICSACNFKRADVFCITSVIIVGIENEDGTHITQTRRIYNHETDMLKLERLNLLSRHICENHPESDEINRELKSILAPKKRIRISVLIGYIITATALCINFGGHIYDGIVSGIIAVAMYFINTYFKLKSVNIIIYTVLCSIISGSLAILFINLGFGIHTDKIMIGNVMLLIPGISTINSVRDLLCGDIMSGLLRLIAAVLIAVSIACGFAIPILLWGM